MRTPELNDERDPYKRMIISPVQPTVYFGLKTCQGGGILLQKDVDSDMETSPGYEIVVNENDESVLRRMPGGEELGRGSIIPADCDTYR